MTEIPYLELASVVLTANGTGTFSQPVPNTQTLSIREWVFTSLGLFQITGIRTSDGRNYTNASPSVPIPSAVLPSGANNFNAIHSFIPELVIPGNVILYIDFKDISAAPNTVNLLLAGHLTVAGN